ncbi:MAG: dihydrofolate reductase [Verrucomicrobiales bacterium]|jgi:dihydrofolate reductase|nr:dihydrofolate reductase [Verrucomicrobiales bacterium]|tara:strand:+ start:6844 stop:7326 length:483 start_codon:yes stop_codon:yes gene_type:complete
MSRPVIKAIVGMASNRVIGKDGDLAWRLPEDLKWFKKLTIGHPIVMGRKTMDSLPNGPLPKRRNVVISRSVSQGPEGFEMVGSCEEAIELLKDEEAIFVIGGAQIYSEMIPQCEEVLLSYVFHPYEGDTFLPQFEEGFELAEVLHRDEDFELRRYRASAS